MFRDSCSCGAKWKGKLSRQAFSASPKPDPDLEQQAEVAHPNNATIGH